MNVVPAQSEQLGAAGAGEHGEHEQSVQLGVARSDVVEEGAQLLAGRWAHFAADCDEPMGPFDGVVPNPSPAHRLGER